jgi:hypothetical protein
MRRDIRNAFAALTAAVIVGAGAGSAAASSDTIPDRHSDVVRYEGEDTETTSSILGHVESINTGVDARSLRIGHGVGYVGIRITYARLTDDTNLSVGVNLRRNGQRTAYATWEVQSEEVDGTHIVLSRVRSASTVRCSVPVTVTPGRLGSVYVQIPRKCLGTPSTLRASAATGLVDLSSDDLVSYVDQISPTQYRHASWTDWVSSS